MRIVVIPAVITCPVIRVGIGETVIGSIPGGIVVRVVVIRRIPATARIETEREGKTRVRPVVVIAEIEIIY
jgi:hypothetical protein